MPMTMMMMINDDNEEVKRIGRRTIRRDEGRKKMRRTRNRRIRMMMRRIRMRNRRGLRRRKMARTRSVVTSVSVPQERRRRQLAAL